MNINRRQFLKFAISSAALLSIGATETVVQSIGNIQILNFPSGWLPCDGRSVSKVQYMELFSALGPTYGDDGDNFKLPDFRGQRLRGGIFDSIKKNDTGTRSEYTRNCFMINAADGKNQFSMTGEVKEIVLKLINGDKA